MARVLLKVECEDFDRLFWYDKRKGVSNKLKLMVFPVDSRQPFVGRAFVFFFMAILLLLRALAICLSVCVESTS